MDMKRTTPKVLLAIIGLWLLIGATARATDTVTYIYTDPQGTPLAEADVHGNITATFDYTPYGTVALGTSPNGSGYTGHVNDAETSLVYMQARYYDPVIGRFLGVDPISPSEGDVFSFNRYTYASNNPIANTDPDGMDSCPQGSSGQCPNNQQPQPPPSPKSPKTLPAVVVIATRPAPLELPAAPMWLVRGVSGIGLYLVDANGFHDWIFGRKGCYGALTCDGGFNQYSKGKKIPKPGVSGKDGAKDVPSWAKGERPNIGENGKDFADRLFGKKYGGAPKDRGPGSEWSKIRKWGDRAFTDPVE